MIQYIISLLIILFTYLFFNLYWKPKRKIQWYKKKCQELGYTVKIYPIKIMRSPVFSQMSKDQKQYQDCLKCLKQNSKYDLVIANFLNKVCVEFVSPQLIKDFYNINNQASLPKLKFMLANVRRVLGQGIAFSQGSQWKKKRKIINTVFNFDFLKNCIPKMIETCNQEFKYHQDVYLKDNPQAIKGQFQIYTMNIFSGIFQNIMLKCFFGAELSSKHIDGERFSNVLNSILADISKQSLHPHALLFGAWILNLGLTSFDRKVNKKVKILRQQAQKTIQKRVQQLKNKQRSQNYSDMIQALMNKNAMQKENKKCNQDIYNYKELIDQFCTFYTAGTDTTSHFITVLIYYLAKYPQCQKKLRQQVDTFIKCDDDIINYEILKKMKYIDCLQNQTLRHYGPTVGIFIRQAQKDLMIKNFPVKKDTYLAISFIGNHYNPKNFQNPQNFNPQRWMNNSKLEQLDSFAFIPFSAGARTCIGRQLALLESKIALIKFVQRYKQFIIPKKDFAMQMKFLPQPEIFKTKLILA